MSASNERTEWSVTAPREHFLNFMRGDFLYLRASNFSLFIYSNT